MANQVSTADFLKTVNQYERLFMTVSMHDGHNVRSVGYEQTSPDSFINFADRTVFDPRSKQAFNLDQHMIEKTIEDQNGRRLGFILHNTDRPVRLSMMFVR